jgi:hypothetical protein
MRIKMITTKKQREEWREAAETWIEQFDGGDGTQEFMLDLLDDFDASMKEAAKLRKENKKFRGLLQRSLEVMPVAADCPEADVNRVDYTDEKWIEICAVTMEIRQLLGER